MKEIGKQEYVKSVLKERKESMVGMICEKVDFEPGMKEWRVMDDEWWIDGGSWMGKYDVINKTGRT